MKKKKLKSLKLSIRKKLLIWVNMLKKTLKLHKRSNRKQDLGKKKFDKFSKEKDKGYFNREKLSVLIMEVLDMFLLIVLVPRTYKKIHVGYLE